MREFDNSKVETLQQIRNKKNLFKQIKKDYKDLCETWTMFQRGQTEISENELMFEKIAWIKIGIQQIRMLNYNSIEGISWGEIKDIENDVWNIKRKLKKHEVCFK